MNDETERVKHDTDALLLKYAPNSQDVDVCISRMQDHIAELEEDGISFSREECRALLAELSIVGRPTQREALKLWPARQSAITKLKGALTDE